MMASSLSAEGMPFQQQQQPIQQGEQLVPIATATTTTPFHVLVALRQQQQQGHPPPASPHRLEKEQDATETTSSTYSSGGTQQLAKILTHLNVSLPDIDDMSMNHVITFMEHYEVDLFWSFLSDSFFIVGGLSYIALTLWNYRWSSVCNKYHIMLDIWAPLVYLFNSMIDIEWAIKSRQRFKNRQSMTKLWEQSRRVALLRGASSVSLSAPSTALASPTVPAVAAESNTGDDDARRTCAYWWHKIRKHAAHRRTLAAASTFGMAAFLAMAATLVRNLPLPPTWQRPAYYNDVLCDALSDHVYVVSAIISLTGKRTRAWMQSSASMKASGVWHDPEKLEDLGDILFLIGSLMDVILRDFRLKLMFAILPVWSSLLWLLDGCLYMRSDFVKAAQLHDTRTLETIV